MWWTLSWLCFCREVSLLNSTSLAIVTAYLRHSHVLPIILRVREHLQEHRRAIDQHVVELVATGFEYPDCHFWVLCQASGDCQAGRSSTDNDIVIVMVVEVFGRSANGGKVNAVGVAIGAVYAVRRHSGKIGEVKLRASGLERSGIGDVKMEMFRYSLPSACEYCCAAACM